MKGENTGTAKALLDELGEALIGRTIYTQRYGNWPGGQAIVKEIAPDPGAPEIVFTVLGIGKRINDAILRGRLDSPVIGVFENEIVDLMYI